METAADVIKSSLQEILVQASESDLEPPEFQDGLKYLNRMMDSFAADGINLGYTTVSTLADPITVPGGAIMGILKNLAVLMWPQFSSPGTPVNPSLIEDARVGMLILRKLGRTAVGQSSLAGAPIGSGSERDFQHSHFFAADDDEILTEQNQFIATEDDTEAP
jgi:hypothetical protein